MKNNKRRLGLAGLLFAGAAAIGSAEGTGETTNTKPIVPIEGAERLFKYDGKIWAPTGNNSFRNSDGETYEIRGNELYHDEGKGNFQKVENVNSNLLNQIKISLANGSFNPAPVPVSTRTETINLTNVTETPEKPQEREVTPTTVPTPSIKVTEDVSGKVEAEYANTITGRTMQILDSQWDAYQKHDSRLYNELTSSLEALSQNVGNSETFQDDAYLDVLKNVEDISNSVKRQVDEKSTLFTGASTTEKVSETLNRLKALKEQYQTHLNTYTKGLKEYNESTKNAQLLSQSGEASIEAKRNEIQNNINQLTTAITNFDSLIQYLQKVPKDLEFKPTEFNIEDYTGDDNLETLVNYLGNVKQTAQSELGESQLFESWNQEVYKPQLNSLRNLLVKVNDSYLVPEGMQELIDNYDFSNGVVHDVATEKKSLVNAINSIDELLEEKLSRRTPTRITTKATEDKERSTIGITFGATAAPWSAYGKGYGFRKDENGEWTTNGVSGNLAGAELGIVYNKVGFVLNGAYGFDELLEDIKTEPSPTGRYFQGNILNTQRISAGLSFEYYPSDWLILGLGANANFSNLKTNESIRNSSGEIVASNNNSEFNFEPSGKAYLGFQGPIGRKDSGWKGGFLVGYDSRTGPYAGMRITSPHNKYDKNEK